MNKIEGGVPPVVHREKQGKERLAEAMQKVEGRTRSLELNQPKVLGLGSENAVFEIAGHPDAVAKVDLKELKTTIKEDAANKKRWDALSGNTEDDASEAAREAAMKEFAEKRSKDMLEKIAAAKARWEKLKEYFPAFAKDEKYYIDRVPVNGEIFEAATGIPPEKSKLDTERLIALPAILRVQEKIPQEVLDSPDTFDLGMNYQEGELGLSLQQYEKDNQDLLLGDGKTAAEYLKKTETAGKKNSLAKLMRRMQTDPKLKGLMEAFTSHAIAYTNDTGEMLDIFGKSNILVHKNADNQWTMSFMDALHPYEQGWNKAQDSLKKDPSDPDFKRTHAGQAVNALNYAKSINALASISGLEDRLHLPDATALQDAKKFLTTTRNKLHLGTIDIPQTDQQEISDAENPARNREITEEIPVKEKIEMMPEDVPVVDLEAIPMQESEEDLAA